MLSLDSFHFDFPVSFDFLELHFDSFDAGFFELHLDSFDEGFFELHFDSFDAGFFELSLDPSEDCSEAQDLEEDEFSSDDSRDAHDSDSGKKKKACQKLLAMPQIL